MLSLLYITNSFKVEFGELIKISIVVKLPETEPVVVHKHDKREIEGKKEQGNHVPIVAICLIP